jgi:hypothetical protein
MWCGRNVPYRLCMEGLEFGVNAVANSTFSRIRDECECWTVFTINSSQARLTRVRYSSVFYLQYSV